MLDRVLNSLRNKRTKDKVELKRNFEYEIFMTKKCFDYCVQMRTCDKDEQIKLKSGVYELEGCKVFIIRNSKADDARFRICRIE